WMWIGIFILIQTTVYLLFHFEIIASPYSSETLLFFPPMFLFFTMIASVFELQNEKHRTNTMRANEELNNSQKALSISYAHLEQQVFQRTRELQDANVQLVQEVQEKARAIVAMQDAEKKFQHAQRMEAVGTLVGGIAHDFNNMLSGITANLYMAHRQMDSEDGRKRLGKIGDLTMHAAEMIKQLLTFARKDEAEMKAFDLSLFTREAFKLASVSIPESINCRSDICHEKLCIHGSATQIQQILMNLMNNARDALTDAEHPEISVSLTSMHADAQKRHYALLQVEDNGSGIAKDQIDKVFDPFFTTKEVGKGTGLGLAMIYGAVQSHDGLIEVQSVPGSGTTFSLYFPVAESTTDSQGDVLQKEVAHGNGETILLVDDDAVLRECHRELLLEMNYKVLTACDGLEAYKVYQQHQQSIALVIMDVVMPLLGGVASANRIRKLNPDAKIIFATGYDKANELTTELTADWQHVLNKPLVVEELSDAIRRQLETN
ncbi:MAG: ATP-binding protein, partial [Mariprofundus sp.]